MISPLPIYWSVRSYYRTRHYNFRDGAELRRHQQALLARQLPRVAARSPYYRAYAELPHMAWPTMDKVRMLAHFDRINTAGLRIADVWETALRAERSRDFLPTLHGISVGMSSGTSGQRGVFVVSRREQCDWVGALLARVLPRGLRGRQRVALFLRADNNLYHAVRAGGLELRFFDLFEPFVQQLKRMCLWQPTYVVAPAQVLRAIAMEVNNGRMAPLAARALSVAEVLEPQDQDLLARAFAGVGEIYQASEGFLGVRCSHGVLHLNEEDILVEPEWLDARRTRFVPVITDLRRMTQPIIRYRLDDVLHVHERPCGCGRVTLAVAAIDGRCDDQLQLPAHRGGVVTVFADLVARALAQALPAEADYRLRQLGVATLELQSAIGALQLAHTRRHLEGVLALQGADVELLRWQLLDAAPVPLLGEKRRRIVRLFPPAGR
ncbi:F390 synthetase-related protein [Rugamonas aquatica]|uniref:CoF synthetase n=1 Tax=Rugamonas aquatica TaxID=2743357 RepID=A0A6A7N6E5_9BURK|nr:F390 synthetase-related protein [Rugamonas aquatica]MQA40620.1 CoF synthetase [Rugamonas aquatica]